MSLDTAKYSMESTIFSDQTTAESEQWETEVIVSIFTESMLFTITNDLLVAVFVFRPQFVCISGIIDWSFFLLRSTIASSFEFWKTSFDFS